MNVTDRVDINNVLMQMRTMKSQIQPHTTTQLVNPIANADLSKLGNIPSTSEVPSFSEMLGDAVNKVNDTAKTSGALAKAFEVGDPNVSLTQVMVASQKASVSFEAMTQVRNKLVDAYEKVMAMPI